MVDFITPQTETSIWYFWGMARDFNPHDEALTASVREGQGKILAKTWKCSNASNRTCWPIRSATCSS